MGRKGPKAGRRVNPRGLRKLIVLRITIEAELFLGGGAFEPKGAFDQHARKVDGVLYEA